MKGGQAVDCEVPTKLDDPSDLLELNVDLYRPEALAECVCVHSWNDLPECDLKGEHRLGGRNHPSSYSTGNALGAIRASECTVQFDGFWCFLGCHVCSH